MSNTDHNRGQEVSGLILHAFRRDSERLLGDPQRIFDGELEHLKSNPERFSWDDLVQLYARLEALGYSLEEAGTTVLDVPVIHRTLQVIGFANSPATACILGIRFTTRRLFNNLDFDYEQPRAGELIMRVTIQEHCTPCAGFFRLLAGSLRMILGAMGVDTRDLQATIEPRQGTYRLSLPTTTGRWWRFLRNIQAWKARESVLAEAAERELLLNERNRELAEALQVKRRFLSVISHELRTPLNGIIGSATFLRDASDAGEREQFLSKLNESSARLLRVVSGIVELSQLEDQACKAITGDCHVRSCVRDAIESARTEAAGKGLRFELHFDANVPVFISIDSQRLSAILDHLCDNAVKFTHSGECSIHVGVHSCDGTSSLEISVRDTGIGINPEDRDYIFEMFSQADDSSARNFQGAGLGLALSQRIAHLLGGRITLEESSGRGSRFLVSLPFEAARLAEVQQDAGKDAEVLPVLVVDDSRTNRVLLCHLLHKLNWEVDQAENGAEAVSRSARRKYGVIFMDCEMPVMDGFEATQQLRARGDTTPIVAVTAYVSDDARLRCQKAGMNQFIGKPVAANQIRAAMELWTGRECGTSD